MNEERFAKEMKKIQEELAAEHKDDSNKTV